MPIEISVCERDSRGRKLDKKVTFRVGATGGRQNCLMEYAIDRVESIAVRGQKKRDKARNRFYGVSPYGEGVAEK